MDHVGIADFVALFSPAVFLFLGVQEPCEIIAIWMGGCGGERRGKIAMSFLSVNLHLRKKGTWPVLYGGPITPAISVVGKEESQNDGLLAPSEGLSVHDYK